MSQKSIRVVTPSLSLVTKGLVDLALLGGDSKFDILSFHDLNFKVVALTLSQGVPPKGGLELSHLTVMSHLLAELIESQTLTSVFSVPLEYQSLEVTNILRSQFKGRHTIN